MGLAETKNFFKLFYANIFGADALENFLSPKMWKKNLKIFLRFINYEKKCLISKFQIFIRRAGRSFKRTRN